MNATAERTAATNIRSPWAPARKGLPKKQRQDGRLHTQETLERWAGSNYIILDTETTGTSANSGVLEIAVIDSQGRVLLDSLVDPGASPMHPAAARVHGITRADVRGKPTFDDLWPELRDIIESHDLILAYNTQFDMRLMRQSLRDRAAQVQLATAPQGCIMRAYANWWKMADPENRTARHRSLNQAAQECRVGTQSDIHTAVEDCETARRVLAHMTEKALCLR